MRYPDPELLARRCIIEINNRGEPHVVYRANGLNPTDIWGKPVPYIMGSLGGDPEDVILTFEDYIAPFGPYSPCLQLTSDLPADTPPGEIKFTPHPNAKVHTLRNIRNVVLHPAEHQQTMTGMRDYSIKKLFKKAVERMGLGDSASEEQVQAAVQVVAALMCVSPALVNKVLKIPSVPKTDGVPNPRMTGRQHSFPKSATSEHAYKLKALKAAVQQCRTNRGDSSFVLQDLYVEGERGGFATRCPVLGVDLAWDEPASYYAPRIGRRDTRTPYVSGNVTVVSMLARKMVEGKTIVALPILLKKRPILAEMFKEWTAKHPPVPNEKITEAVEEAIKNIKLQKLVDDWEE